VTQATATTARRENLALIFQELFTAIVRLRSNRQSIPNAESFRQHIRDAVKKAANAPGITLIEDLPDLRQEVGSHAVVVLPFVSGGGIKNKLLEAAAMGKAIVCTPRVMSGLKGDPPLVQAKTPAEWTAAIVDIWNNDARRRQLGTASRAWVLEHHTWTAAARDAIAGLEASRTERAAW